MVHRLSFDPHLPSRVILLCMMWAVVSCAAVDVRVESLSASTPTLVPAPPPLPTPAVQAQFSAGLVAREAPDDSNMRVATIATPHLIFNGDGSVLVEMLPDWVDEEAYFVINRDIGVRLRVDWRAIWLTDSTGSGRISMDVYLRYPDASEDDFQWVENASTADFAHEGAYHREELLDSTLYLSTVGNYGIRVEVKAEAWNDTIGAYAEDAYIYEGLLIALAQPDELIQGVEALSPAFADLEWQGVLFDWRGWRLGPCFVRSEGNSEFTRLLDEACAAFEGGDWDEAASALQGALSADESPMLRNRLRQQLGILSAASGRWNVAVRHFTEGLSIAHELGDSLEVATALQNLGVALLNVGFVSEGESQLWKAINLYDQMEDWPSVMLTWGQLSVHWESIETFDWVVPALYDHGLPQAVMLEAIADDLRERVDNSDTSDE